MMPMASPTTEPADHVTLGRRRTADRVPLDSIVMPASAFPRAAVPAAFKPIRLP